MDDDNERVLETINLLKDKEIKLIAIDFDNTFISIHTSGIWAGTVEQLARYVRPMFVKLVDNIVSSTSINVAVVTFSTQTELIARLLKRVLSNPDGVYVQTTTRELQSFKKKLPGKEGHISLVLKNVFINHGLKINNKEIFLIDDDEENINAASKYNHFVYCFKEETTLKSINDYLGSLFVPSNMSLFVNHSNDSNFGNNAAIKENQFKNSLDTSKTSQDLNKNVNSFSRVPFLFQPMMADNRIIKYNFCNNFDPRLNRNCQTYSQNFLFRNSNSNSSISGNNNNFNHGSYHRNNISSSAVVYIPVLNSGIPYFRNRGKQ